MKTPVMNGNTQNGSGSETRSNRKVLENSGNGIATLRNTSETTQNTDDPTTDVAFLTKEVERLESELEAAGKREAKLEARTDKLLEMLAVEQEKTRLLMLPKPESEPENVSELAGVLPPEAVMSR